MRLNIEVELTFALAPLGDAVEVPWSWERRLEDFGNGGAGRWELLLLTTNSLGTEGGTVPRSGPLTWILVLRPWTRLGTSDGGWASDGACVQVGGSGACSI